MLSIGIIGYGRRIAHMAKELNIFGIPYRVTAVADPRGDRIRATNDPFLADTRFYASAEELLAAADELDGIMIGTRCNLHTEMALKVAPTELPLFLEKPVAITFDEVRRLDAAYQDYAAPTVVSLVVETIDFSGDMPHFGGDRELSFDFLMAMRDGRSSRSPIAAGILSALTCLWARESANNRQPREVVMPEAVASG